MAHPVAGLTAASFYEQTTTVLLFHGMSNRSVNYLVQIFIILFIQNYN